MLTNLVAIAYVISGVFFIIALRGLSSPESSRRGNIFGILGMVIAILATLFSVNFFTSDIQTIAFVIVAITIGEEKAQETVRKALAVGADRGIHVKVDNVIEPLAVSKILKKIVEKENPDLVFMGKQAIDDDCNQTGQMLAALLNWPQATFASKIEVKDNALEVTREIDEGLETIEVNVPAIVTCDLRLNEPRYASLPNIMKAKKKPIEQINASDLGVDTSPRIEHIKFEEPPKRKAGIKVASVEELVQKLKNEAKVI